MKRIAITALTLMVMLLQVARGQEKREVAGTLSDTAGLPLPGVSVVVKGTQTGTSTDLEGNYRISAAPDDVLQFSLLGYQPVERTAREETLINVEMQTSGYQLSDVVVIGYQITSRRSVTTSIASVSAEDIRWHVTGNVVNAWSR